MTFYHILHVTALLLLSGLASALVLNGNKKPYNILYGIASFLVLLGGFGLIARLGYSFKSNPWLTVKLIIWLVLSAGVPIIVKRLKLEAKIALPIIYGLLFLGVLMVYARPF